MQVKITELLNNETVYSKEYPPGFSSKNGMQEAEGIYSYRSNQFQFAECWFEGMLILVIDIGIEKPCTVLLATDTACYTMLFCQEGKLNCKSGRGLKNGSMSAQENIFLNTHAGSVQVELHQSAKTVCIQLTEEYYERLVLKHGDALSRHTPVFKTTAAMQMILNSVCVCKYAPAMKRVFLEAKVLELLCLLMEQQSPASAAEPNTYIRKHDVERIQYAKTLIEQNIQTPCSLIELAHKAGLNDFKLKKGFKEVLGTTVFGYLHDLRMGKARQMLLEEKRTVNDVSHEVGYKNPQHFTAAFKKKYGILPSQLNK